MFSISWIVYPPNLVILGILFLFLRSVLVKNRKVVRILKTVNPIFQNWDSKIHRNSQKTPKMENKLCKCSGWHYLHDCSRGFIRFFLYVYLLIFSLFLTILGLISYFLCFFYFSLNSAWFSFLVQVLWTGTEVLVYCFSPFEHLYMFWPINPKYSIWLTWLLCI